MSVRDVLYFDSMLTPKVVTIVYWLLLLAALLAGIGSMFYTGFQYMSLITARIWCELMIVLFKLNENVQRLANPK